MAAADLIIVGPIATLARAVGHGWVEALAIGGGRVLAAGPQAEVDGLAGRRTARWRLPRGHVALPSFTDAHLHLTDAALAAGRLDLDGLDLAACLAVVRAGHERQRDAGDASGWLLGHGWSLEGLGGPPVAATLDRAAPGRPVALWSHDHHARWLSTEALRRAGLDDSGDPPRGRIIRDERGRPTGLLLENAANLVDTVIPAVTEPELTNALVAFAAELAALGVTSVHDPGGLAPDPELRWGSTFYRRLAEEGRLPLRVVASVREEQLERAMADGFRSGRGPERDASRDGAAGGHYRDGWLKLFADGALGSRTAALLAPYEPDDPAGPPPGGPSGILLHDQDLLASICRRAAAAGIASQVHAIGDAAVRRALEVLEVLPRVGRVHHRIEHAQLVHPSDVARFAPAGIAASVQPCHLLTDAPGMRRAWGDRAAHAFPLAALVTVPGALLPLGTDAPVEPPDPWPGLTAAVTRRGAGWPSEAALHPQQAMSLARALRAACLDGPRSLGVDDEGHLGAGARADLIVVPDEALREPVSPQRLATTRPLATFLDGRLVHAAPGFDADAVGA